MNGFQRQLRRQIKKKNTRYGMIVKKAATTQVLFNKTPLINKTLLITSKMAIL
jgi:hypothetical protein